jgi:TorA maturation chaperone TorD
MGDMSEVTRTDPLSRAHEILRLVANNRSQCYHSLAETLSFPDASLVERVNSGNFRRSFLQATAWLGEDQARLARILAQIDAGSGGSLDGYQAEYNRFFVKSIDRVSPCESSYRWREAGQLAEARYDLIMTLQHTYGQFGVNCAPGMEDHAAVELEFLALLCNRESMFWEQEAAKTARGLRSQQRTFVDDHLSRWLPEFCHRLKNRAGSAFYGLLAGLCDEWLSLDQGQGYIPIAD